MPSRNTIADCPAKFIVGIDEAGRGCLAGPVLAAAVILPEDFSLPGLGDSKKISRLKRENLAALIREQSLGWSVGLSWPREIERVNILQATLLAMSRALINLKKPFRLVLLDGLQAIPPEYLKNLPSKFRQQAVPHGDELIPVISAASIIAKTFRDKIMRGLARRFAGYCLESHFGYPTKKHRQAIAALGPTSLHRLSFKGVREHVTSLPRQLSLLDLL